MTEPTPQPDAVSADKAHDKAGKPRKAADKSARIGDAATDGALRPKAVLRDFLERRVPGRIGRDDAAVHGEHMLQAVSHVGGDAEILIFGSLR